MKDAVVTLLDLTVGETVGSFTGVEGEDAWLLPYYPVVGHSYRLEVVVPDQDLIYAEQVMPGSGIQTFDLMYSEWDPENGKRRQYSECGFRYAYCFSFISHHCWIYGLNYNEESGAHELVEEICTDYPYVDNFNLTGGLYTSPDTGILVGTPGFLQDAPVHRRFLRIPKVTEDVREEDAFIVAGSFSGEYFGRQKDFSDEMGVVQVMAVSDEYDHYLRELMILSEQQESSDLSDIFVRENIYTNIHGGVGFWGARNVTPLRWYTYDY